jgi:hypothetical protein
MSAFKPSQQMRRMQIVALLLLVASGIVNYLDRSALSIANIEVRQELGLSATAMGVLLSAFLMSSSHLAELAISYQSVGGRHSRHGEDPAHVCLPLQCADRSPGERGRRDGRHHEAE